MKDNNLSVEQLGQVTGGNAQEYEELKAFINKIDPEYEVDGLKSVMLWISNNSGIEFDTIATSMQGPNYFILDNNKRITQSELMAMLREKFPDC